MGSRFFNVFYLEFIKQANKLKFIKNRLLQEFIQKLSSYMQNRMNFELEYLDNIKDLIMCYQKIYD